MANVKLFGREINTDELKKNIQSTIDEASQAASVVKKRIAVYEAQNAKGLFGLTYKTRIKLWTGLFAAAIIIWIICKLIK